MFLLCGITHGMFVMALKGGILVTMILLALKRGFLITISVGHQMGHSRYDAGAWHWPR
jgi:hypothetical protein